MSLPLSCNIFVLYVISLDAHGPSWPTASIKYLSIYFQEYFGSIV